MTKPVRVYMTVGDVERNRSSIMNQCADFFVKKELFRCEHLASKVLENTGHSGTKSETFSQGHAIYF